MKSVIERIVWHEYDDDNGMLPKDFERCLVTVDSYLGKSPRRVTMVEFVDGEFESIDIDDAIFNPECDKVVAWASLPEAFSV